MTDRHTVAGLAFLAFLAVAAALVTLRFTGPAPEASQPTLRPALDFNSLAAISVDIGTNSVTCAARADGWWLSESVRANESALTTLVDCLAHPVVLAHIETPLPSGTTLADYGLDPAGNPALDKVTFLRKNGTDLVVRLGKSSPNGAGRYALYRDSSDTNAVASAGVWVLDSWVNGGIPKDTPSFRYTLLLPRPNLTFDWIELHVPDALGAVSTLRLDSRDTPWPGCWSLQNGEYPANPASVAKLIRALQQAQIEDALDLAQLDLTADPDADAEKYGFKPETLRKELRLSCQFAGSGDQPFSLRFGPATNGLVSVYAASERRVLTVADALAATLRTTLDELRDHRLLRFSPDDVGVIRLDTPDISLELVRATNGLWSVARPVQAPAAQETVAAWLAALAAATDDRWLAEPAVQQAEGPRLALLAADGGEAVSATLPPALHGAKSDAPQDGDAASARSGEQVSAEFAENAAAKDADSTDGPAAPAAPNAAPPPRTLFSATVTMQTNDLGVAQWNWHVLHGDAGYAQRTAVALPEGFSEIDGAFIAALRTPRVFPEAGGALQLVAVARTLGDERSVFSSTDTNTGSQKMLEGINTLTAKRVLELKATADTRNAFDKARDCTFELTFKRVADDAIVKRLLHLRTLDGGESLALLQGDDTLFLLGVEDTILLTR